MQPYYDKDGITIYNADCREVLPQLGTFDLLLTDPPYGIGDRMQGGTWGAKQKYADFREWDQSPDDWTFKLIMGAAQSSVIWGGNYFNLPGSRCYLVWRKTNSVPTMAGAELAWTDWDSPVKAIDHPVSKHTTGHPSQKPLTVMRWCLSLVPNAETILDPFMGSGTTLVAAKLEGRKAVGIEINEQYCEAAANRLAQGVLF